MTPREQELTKALVSALNLIEWASRLDYAPSEWTGWYRAQEDLNAIREALVEKEAKSEVQKEAGRD